MSVLDAAAIVAAGLRNTGAEEQTDWDVYSETMHTQENVRWEVLEQLRARTRTGSSELTVFDVGAGTGGFLDMARSRGFRTAGNDISQSAIDHAAAHYGIRLSATALPDQPPQSVDAITLWCVLAHVGDPRAFLDSARRMLRPGGILFLRTPRWCAADAIGGAVATATRGHLAKVPDQRVTRGHLHLYRDEGMRSLLADLGFTDLDVQPVSHTGCTGAEIASRLGGPAPVQRWTSRAIDRLMSSGMAPRNTMFVYARRPVGDESAPRGINRPPTRTSGT